MPGPPPKPTALKLLHGNPGQRKLPVNEPKPKPIAPDRPKWLTGEARKMWDRLAPELERLGLLTVVDGDALAAACQSYATWLECQLFMKKEGITYSHANVKGERNSTLRPEYYAADKALSQYKSFCTEFGLTPASRTRLGSPAEENLDDEMERLLSMR